MDCVVYCAAAEDVDGVTAWLAAEGAAAHVPVRSQVQEADLGRRMIHALTAAAAVEGAGAAQHTAAILPAQQPTTGPCACEAAAVGEGGPCKTMPQQQQVEQCIQQQQGTVPPSTPAAKDSIHQQQHHHHNHHRYKAAIVVGTDIPDLSQEVIAAAAAALLGGVPSCTAAAAAAAPDMVLGPAADGGYYLLGFRTEALLSDGVQQCKVFEGVEWSCATVLQRTAAASARLGLQVAAAGTLPMLQDIDTLDDAAAWVMQGVHGGNEGKGEQDHECGDGDRTQHQRLRRQKMRQLIQECLLNRV